MRDRVETFLWLALIAALLAVPIALMILQDQREMCNKNICPIHKESK